MVISGRRADALDRAAAALRERTGGCVHKLVTDIREPESAKTAVAEVEAAHGALDVLVLNAGGPPPGRILDLDDQAWQDAFELLLLGPLRLARLALPPMAARGFGRVVLVTSTAVRQPQPDLAVSVVLRSAVTAAAKLLAREFAADGVTVNCVAPGATATERRRQILENRARQGDGSFDELDAEDAAAIPAGRAAQPEEIAAAVAFLASRGGELRQRDRADGRRRTNGDDLMAQSGPEFTLADFLGGLSDTVRPAVARPVVVHAAELEPLPADQVHNPSALSIAGRLPTTTFEIFRQTIPPGLSSDMQRHHHETVHYVISGDGHSEIEDETAAWSAGDFIYTPPWTWHRHYNDSADAPVEFLTIENSRLLGLLGVGRRQSAGLATVEEARARFGKDTE